MTATATTRTRTQVNTLDSQAMNTTDPEELKTLCGQGSRVACQLLSEPKLTAQQKEEMARNRDAQAASQREATAQKLLSAGVNQKIAEAARSGRDVRYTKIKSWYQKRKYWVIAGSVSLLVVALLFKMRG